jgi:WD40 repeat protein
MGAILMPRVFLSYARSDDIDLLDSATSFVARLHRDLTAAAFEVWFDRVSMPSRSLTFHQEIRDAITACDRLLLIGGPKASESLYVRQEWQFAYFEAEKTVTPILRRGDFKDVPAELKLLHCEDFRDDRQYDFHLKNLVRQLAEPMPSLGKLIGVPSLPPHFLSRTDRLMTMRDALRADLDQPVVVTQTAARIGIQGMGGIGKSVLAATVARDRKIREAFPDGIVWIGFGPLPTIADLQRRVHKDLGGDGAFQTEHEGRVKLRDLFLDKRVLLILDDVWRREDVDWFDILGPRCRMLILTRDTGLLSSLGVAPHIVELLTSQESLDLLAQSVGVECTQLPDEASDLIVECGRLPLAVALCGGMVQSGIPWSDLLGALREHELEFISDEHRSVPQHANLWRAMEVSVRTLGERAGDEPLLRDAARRFVELAVFPNEEPIPEAAVLTLWSHTAALKERYCRKLLVLLQQRSLVQRTHAADGTQPMVSLHALLFDLAVRLAQRDIGDTKALHNLLVEAYVKQCPAGLPSGPNDGYYFTHLRHHFIAAGRVRELADLLHDLRWLEAKNQAGLAFDLCQEFVQTVASLPEDDGVRRRLALLGVAVRRDVHFMDRHARTYPQGLFQCLWNSCWWHDCPQTAAHYEEGQVPGPDAGVGLYRLLESWRAEKERQTPGFVWLRSLRPPSTHLGTALRAVLLGHEGMVTSVCCSKDGRWLASGSDDGTVRLWDPATGAPLRCLRGHEDRVASVAFAPNGRILASGSWDRTVRLWDTATGNQLHCLRQHEGRVASVAFATDGRRLASGSWDRTVRLWDTAAGNQLRCLLGHEREVLSVAFGPDGCTLASGSDDRTVRIWKVADGTQVSRLLGHEGRVATVSFAPDGRTLASGSADQTVRIWNTTNGAPLLCLRGHESSVRNLAFLPDGCTLVSASGDQAIRVWDVAAGALVRDLVEHEDRIASVAFAPDGHLLASGSWDHTVRLWDAATGAPLFCLRGHEGAVWSVAFAPDGRTLASGADDWTVRIWDAVSGAQVHCLQEDERVVGSVAYAPDGRTLATGAGDGQVRVWDTVGGALLHCLRGHRGRVGTVAFAPTAAPWPVAVMTKRCEYGTLLAASCVFACADTRTGWTAWYSRRTAVPSLAVPMIRRYAYGTPLPESACGSSRAGQICNPLPAALLGSPGEPLSRDWTP